MAPQRHLNKITVKNLGMTKSDKERLVIPKEGEEPKGEIAIARIFGRVASSKVETSTFGDYVVFNGDFKAKNLLNDNTYRSGVLILPEPAQSLLTNQLAKVEDGSQAQFGVDITIQYRKPRNEDDKSALFQYGVISHMDAEEDDSLADLENLIAEKTGEAPAPQKGKKAKK